MTAYYTSQAYDAPPALIWSILTDFDDWPRWFPNVSSIRFEDGETPAPGVELLAYADDRSTWTRWAIVEWREPSVLVVEHVESNAPMTSQVQTAYIQFRLEEDPDGCTLEVELGAEGYGLVGDFFVNMTMAPSVRRMLPDLLDAFSDHVVARVAAGRT